MYILINFFYSFRKSVLKNTFRNFFYVSKYKKVLKLKLSIYHFFFEFWIAETIKKKNALTIQNKKKFYEKKFIFNVKEDWFSFNIPVWDFILKQETRNKQNIEYLEIGSYEGRSAVYICWEFTNFFVTAVDPFFQYKEIEPFVEDNNMEQKYKTLKKNLNYFKDRTKIFRLTSDDFFKENKKRFDIIYIDGSHHATNVKKDFLNSIRSVKDNGLIILDDFIWEHYSNLNENPIAGILPILEEHSELKIISASNQLIIKKYL